MMGRMNHNENIVIASVAKQSRASLAALDCVVAVAPRKDGGTVPRRDRQY